MGWIEYQGNKRIHPQINLNLLDTKQNRKIANELRKNKEYELKNSNVFYVKKLKIKEAIPIFLASKKDKKKNTYQIYIYSLEKLKDFEEKYLSDIRTTDIKKIISSLHAQDKKEQTIITYIKHIKIFFEYCKTNNLITTNPVEIPKAKVNNVVKIISEDELEEILEHFKKRNIKHYYLLQMLNYTGLRISELININWEDINYNKKTIIIRNTKGNRDEEIILTSSAEKILTEIKIDGPKIFNYKDRNSLKPIANELRKFGYSFHDFRRTYGTRCAKILKPFELKKIMRHNDIRTTDKYYINIELDEIREKINF